MIAVRVRGDRRIARSYRRDMTAAVDRCNARVGGFPIDRAVRCRQRQDLCDERRRIALIEIERGRGHRDRACRFGIHLGADDRLLIQIDTVSCSIQTEITTRVAQITAVDGKSIIRAVPRPVSAAGICCNRQRIGSAAAQIPCFGTVSVSEIERTSACGCLPDRRRYCISGFDIWLVAGFGCARSDRYSIGSGCCRRLRTVQRVIE